MGFKPRALSIPDDLIVTIESVTTDVEGNIIFCVKDRDNNSRYYPYHEIKIYDDRYYNITGFCKGIEIKTGNCIAVVKLSSNIADNPVFKIIYKNGTRQRWVRGYEINVTSVDGGRICWDSTDDKLNPLKPRENYYMDINKKISIQNKSLDLFELTKEDFITILSVFGVYDIDGVHILEYNRETLISAVHDLVKKNTVKQ